MSCCIVLAYNEEKYISDYIIELSKIFEEIIVVNDNSTDKTLEKLENLDINNLTILNNKKNKGAGMSLLNGIKYFLSTEHKYMIKVDGDGQFKVKDIINLNSLSKLGYDFIKGDRFWSEGVEGSIPLIRYIGNTIASILIKISTGNWKINDPLNGLFYFSKKSLENFYLPKIFERYGYPFYINIYMNTLALRNNLKIGQIKNTIQYREEESRLKPSIMLVKLSFYTIHSFLSKIKLKFKYSSLQVSAFLDIIFIFFLINTFYSGINLLLITFGIIDRPKASWLFLTLILFLFSFTSFYYSQVYEKEVRSKYFEIL